MAQPEYVDRLELRTASEGGQQAREAGQRDAQPDDREQERDLRHELGLRRRGGELVGHTLFCVDHVHHRVDQG